MEQKGVEEIIRKIEGKPLSDSEKAWELLKEIHNAVKKDKYEDFSILLKEMIKRGYDFHPTQIMGHLMMRNKTDPYLTCLLKTKEHWTVDTLRYILWLSLYNCDTPNNCYSKRLIQEFGRERYMSTIMEFINAELDEMLKEKEEAS